MADSAIGRSADLRSANATDAPPAAGGSRRRERALPSESRARVLTAAAHLFAQFGFEATSIRQIANELGIVSASLYHYFLTKEDMLDAIVRAPILKYSEEMVRISGLPMDAERRLTAQIICRIKTWLEDPDGHSIAVKESEFFTRREDFHYVENAKLKAFRALESVLEGGVEEGLFRQELDIYYTILAIASMLNAAVRSVRDDAVHAFAPPQSHTAETIAELYIAFILRLVRTTARISEPIPCDVFEMLAAP